MYKITSTNYGIHLLLDGRISNLESKALLTEMITICQESLTDGGVFVDMRKLLPLEPKPQVNFETVQRVARSAGMTRSVVIVSNPTLAFQFKRIARHSGIYAWERYIASTETDWETRGLAWVIDGVDPDPENKPKAELQPEKN